MSKKKPSASAGKRGRQRAEPVTSAGNASEVPSAGAMPIVETTGKRSGIGKGEPGPGRPPLERTKEVEQRIFNGLLDGRSLRAICEDEGMPAASTVFKWLDDDASFAEQYARRKKAGIEAMGEDIIAIADNAVPVDGRVDKDKLRVDTRKWVMSKLLPKKYGESATLKGDPDAPLLGAIVVPMKDVGSAGNLAPEPEAS